MEHCILNFVADGPLERSLFNKTRITVDGRDITHVWFVDTKAGIVKTYNVFPGRDDRSIGWTSRKADGTVHTPADFPLREVECPPDGALSEVLRGKVQVWDKATGELLYSG